MKVVFKINSAALGLVLLVGLAVRIGAVRGVLDTTDDVNFALALERFDLLLHQPHFPGYPIYVLAARAFGTFARVEWALVLPSLVAWPFFAWTVSRAVRGRMGAGAALTAASLLAFAPGLVEIGSAPGSDGLGFALVGGALAMAFIATESRPRPRLLVTAGLIAGLGLGARPSLLPLAIALPIVPSLLGGSVLGSLVGLTVGTIAWAVPFMAVVGPATLMETASTHLAGHFSTWGGAVGSASASLGLGARALALIVAATRGLLIASLVAGAVLLRARPRWHRPALALSLVAVPYALWVWLGQNVERGRHAAPLSAWICVLVAIAIGHAAVQDRALRWAGTAAILAVALGLATTGRPRPWRRDAAAFIATRLGDERVMVLGTHLPRVTRYYAPSLRIGQARSGRDIAAALAETPPGVTVVTSSEIPLYDAALELTPLGRFGEQTLFRASLPGLALR